MGWLKNGSSSNASIWKARMSKQEMRKRLAALSFTEKVRILEKLRDRSVALAASGLREKAEGDVRKKAIKGNAG